MDSPGCVQKQQHDPKMLSWDTWSGSLERAVIGGKGNDKPLMILGSPRTLALHVLMLELGVLILQ